MLKLKADYVLLMDKNFTVLQNAEVVFDKKIKSIGIDLPKEDEEIYLGKNSVLMPALINSHTHLEFSANTTSLEYGDFIAWLDSVIENREELFNSCGLDCYKKAITQMLKSGVCAFGEISSTGSDMEFLRHSPLKVVFFNEIIGSNPAVVDVMYNDFLNRLDSSLQIQNEKFKTGISIHSAYSVHPLLMDKVISIAKEKNLPIQAHFMESKAERLWLDKGDGGFKIFFEKNFSKSKPLISAKEFLQKFKDTHTTFIHCVHANEEEFEIIKENDNMITHCPISNRLLNVGLLNLELVKNHSIDYTLATDGLSSNYSLNLFKELKAALFMHTTLHPKYLAKDLLKAVTTNAAKSLNLNNGSIEIGKDADLIALTLPQEVENIELLPLYIILYTQEVQKLFINGKEFI
ncbi:MAG: metal-dependent hydrolase [Epsilonproteobacteria bacterium]|nr:metal-dependent hydrolase [Campylobacterota bacterium]